MPILHVMFSPAAAGTLRQAIQREGRPDQVACLHDDFSFGPIDGNRAARARWTKEVLGLADWDWAGNVSNFLRETSASDVTPVAWFSRRDTESYAGLLWWLAHLGDVPCRIVDVTELTVDGADGKPWLAVSPSSLWPEQMNKIMDSHVPLGDAQQQPGRWHALVAENAPLRVIDQTGSLVSAPIDYFDPLLLAAATTEWRKMARLMAEAMASFLMDDLRQTNSFVLQARIRSLAENGVLEWRGSLADMGACELRLPGALGDGDGEQ